MKHLPLFILMLLLLLVGNHAISLWDQDEAAYAGFAMRMLRTGDWLIPEFTWSEVHRKTPLTFWLTTISYQLFGINEFALRLPTSLAIFGVYLLTVCQGRKLFDSETATWATAILGTSILVPLYGKIAFTDAILLFFSVLAAFAWVNVLRKKTRTWILLFWLGVAGALLAKGPPILIFGGFLGLLTLIFSPQRTHIWRLQPWFGLPVALLPLLAWGYLTQQRDGGVFVQWLLDWYILKRVGGSVFGQTGPFGYHLAVMLLSFIFYLIFVPKALTKLFNWWKTKNAVHRYLGLWFIAAWFPYELSPSKLPSYALLAHIPFALLLGQVLAQWRTEETPIWYRSLFGSLHFVGIFGLGVAAITVPQFTEIVPDLALDLKILGIVLLLIAVGQLYFFITKKDFFFKWNTILLATVFQLLSWAWLLPTYDYLKNASQEVAEHLAEAVPEATPIFIANKSGKSPSLPFYLERNFPNISESQDPAMLRQYWQENTPIALILTEELYDNLKSELLGAKTHTVSSFLTGKSGRVTYVVVWKR